MEKSNINNHSIKISSRESRLEKVKINTEGKPICELGKRKEEAKSRFQCLYGLGLKPIKPLFSDIATDWLRVQIPQLKESSLSKYLNILKLYLVPSHGYKFIEEITRGEVYSYSLEMLSYGGCKGAGLEPKTVNGILSVMKSIFKYAERERNISVADIADIGVKQPWKPLRILSIKEQKQISNYLYGNLSPCNLGILLCLYMGLRIGEICALKWSDINIDDQVLHVHQTMQRIQILDNSVSKTKVSIFPPKSHSSIRTIPIPDELLPLLMCCKKNGEKYLLTGTEYSYIEPRTMENKFKKIISKCNIQDIKFHTLRHTFATRCVELGFDIKSLSEILGHASVNITLNRYVHPSMDLKQQNMNKLSGFISSNIFPD